jgi:hypothetical protein
MLTEQGRRTAERDAGRFSSHVSRHRSDFAGSSAERSYFSFQSFTVVLVPPGTGLMVTVLSEV